MVQADGLEEKSIPKRTEEKDEWEVEKEKCSFCRHFLGSPCRTDFINWSKCVDAAKESEEDFVAKCQKYTENLVKCTAQYPDFFEGLRGDGAEDDEVEGETLSEMEVDNEIKLEGSDSANTGLS